MRSTDFSRLNYSAKIIVKKTNDYIWNQTVNSNFSGLPPELIYLKQNNTFLKAGRKLPEKLSEAGL